MTSRPITRAYRGHATMERIAKALAVECGIPVDRTIGIVRDLFRIMRDDIDSGPRFVLPGVLVIERNPDGARRSHRFRFTLASQKGAAKRIAAFRARRRSSR